MPPKKAPVSKKTEQKKKDKVVEDKTFGLKNKKGNKMQKYVQQVTHQVKNAGQSAIKLESDKYAERKKQQTDDLKDLNTLLKPVIDMPKVSKDVDPKSVLCLFFKQGMCQKGNKCKWSHNLSIEHKSEKRSLYVDKRDIEDENMDDWDETKLNDVVEKKHGESDRTRENQTDIVCKHFLDAVENSKYGWFWECPNSSIRCIYRHALPPGFILKKERKKLDELKKQDEISLDELIEKERAALSSQNMTKVTLESFISWKKRKLKVKKVRVEEEEKQKRSNFKTGKQMGLSGRDLFTFNPDLIGDDDADADEQVYQSKCDDEDANDQSTDEGFDIDEQTFCTINNQGRLLNDNLLDDEEDKKPSESETTGAVHFNEDLFDADDDALCSDSDDEKRPSSDVHSLANLCINPVLP